MTPLDDAICLLRNTADRLYQLARELEPVDEPRRLNPSTAQAVADYRAKAAERARNGQHNDRTAEAQR